MVHSPLDSGVRKRSSVTMSKSSSGTQLAAKYRSILVVGSTFMVQSPITLYLILCVECDDGVPFIRDVACAILRQSRTLFLSEFMLTILLHAKYVKLLLFPTATQQRALSMESLKIASIGNQSNTLIRSRLDMIFTRPSWMITITVFYKQ